VATNQAPSEPKPLIQTSLLTEPSPFPDGLSGSELAARLGVNASTISRNSKKWEKDKIKFAQWSKLSKEDFSALYPSEKISEQSEKIADPDGLAWQRRGDRYYPIPENQTP
jgi:hypothetical protein